MKTRRKGTVIDIAEGEHFRVSHVKRKFKFTGVIEMQERKTGTDGAGLPSRAPQSNNTRRDDSTRPKIAIAASKRVLITAGLYNAKCVRVDPVIWVRAFRKAKNVLKVHFELERYDFDSVRTVTKFINCGTNPNQPEVGPDTWLGQQMAWRRTFEPEDVFLGRWFEVNVQPSRNGQYSVVREFRYLTDEETERLEKG